MNCKCGFCGAESEKNLTTLFVRNGNAVICEPCIDNAKNECIKERRNAKADPA